MGLTINVNATTMLKKYDVVPNVYVTKISESHQIYDYMYIIVTADGHNPVYCIEPGLHINEEYDYQGYINSLDTYSRLSKEQLDRIKLLAYYGYEYTDPSKRIDHTDKKWYAVTQYLIWQIAPNGHEIYFSSYLQGPRVNIFTEEMNELNNLVDNHYKAPIFLNEDININLGEKVILNDTSKALSEYTVKSLNNNIKILVYDNKLEINANKTGSATITLTKSFKNYRIGPIIYVGENTQTLLRPGNPDDIKYELKVTIKGAKILLEKVDSETITPQGDASLSNATYDLLDSNHNLITTLITNLDGYAESDNILDFNETYYLKETTNSKGYLLDEEEHSFILNSLDTKITLNENIIKRKVNIYKVKSNKLTEITEPEDNISFDIYLKSSNEYYNTITTDKEGFATISLPYGTWIFKQVNSTPDYEKVDDFEIEVIDDTSDINKILVDYNIITYDDITSDDPNITEQELPIMDNQDIIEESINPNEETITIEVPNTYLDSYYKHFIIILLISIKFVKYVKI